MINNAEITSESNERESSDTGKLFYFSMRGKHSNDLVQQLGQSSAASIQFNQDFERASSDGFGVTVALPSVTGEVVLSTQRQVTFDEQYLIARRLEVKSTEKDFYSEAGTSSGGVARNLHPQFRVSKTPVCSLRRLAFVCFVYISKCIKNRLMINNAESYQEPSL